MIAVCKKYSLLGVAFAAVAPPASTEVSDLTAVTSDVNAFSGIM